jgi:glycosyltransferase involved in cell wall biosynthesis
VVPKVTFIVPCYNLAHLLDLCVNSILSQTCEDFEILIMDDCSPDSTPEVARSFHDRRVKYIRNETNLGHIANYNKAIGLARGEYIWLISADDCLRRTYVLERFVRLMDNHPAVGYVFCPSMRLVDGRETEVMTFTAPESRDVIFNGREFLRDILIISDCVPAPAAMARKECYEKISLFPADLPYSADWYLWCMFALKYDVGYFAEPMVNRRFHERNISKFYYRHAASIYYANDMAVPWRVKEKAEAQGYNDLVKRCKDSIAGKYVLQITPKEDITGSITLDEFEESLHRYAGSALEKTELRARVYAGLGDFYYLQNDFPKGSQYYRLAIKQEPRLLSVWVKYILTRTGNTGIALRKGISAFKRHVRTSWKQH